MKSVQLADEALDVAVFSLSLMSKKLVWVYCRS
jgi:hypothetical protein